MIKSRVLLAGALLATAGAANAAVTVTPTVVSDYDFRGIAQTAKDPAFQLSVNYAHDSGFYVGLWGSNVDFGPGDPNIEIDAFAGFAGGDATETFGYDVGVNYYSYVSMSDLNFFEVYGGLSKGPFAAKLWFSPEFGGKYTDESAYYLEGNLNYPIGESGFSALAHVGYSGGDYWDAYYGDGYFDWAVGVSKSFGNFTVSLKYIDGGDLADGPTDIFSTDSKVWASISTTLPWAAD